MVIILARFEIVQIYPKIDRWLNVCKTFLKKVNQWNITTTTEQRSKINLVEVKNPYFLILRYTYSKCELCERTLPYPNLRQKYIEREEITTTEHSWYLYGSVICQECA